MRLASRADLQLIPPSPFLGDPGNVSGERIMEATEGDGFKIPQFGPDHHLLRALTPGYEDARGCQRTAINYHGLTPNAMETKEVEKRFYC